MSITVTMLQTRQGEGGVVWTAGNSYSASDAFGTYLITSNLATGKMPDVPVTTLSPAQVTVTAALVSKDGVLDAASAGASSPWFVYTAGMRLAYALDSGTTTTTFSIDFSADGVTSLGQAFTGTWASSTVAEITPPLYLTNPQARFLRFNVLTGGPLSVSRNI